ncbi:MAG: hypothetical protein EOO61_03295 [Hymenobacter sp.]|nr:MAG: hypothetical protein EOO61_03295 [Hymenobacter sp.]
MVDGAVFLAIERDAETRALNAAYNGSYNDGGASVLKEQIRFYKYGRDNKFPPEWESYRRQVDRESDPEWAELMRLKRKFGE